MTKPEKIRLDQLPDWIEASLREPSEVTRFTLSSRNAKLATFAEDCGLFRKSGHLAQVGCPDCDPSHLCKVVRHGADRYKAHCLLNGWIEREASEVEVLAFDRNRLLDLIRAAFKLGKRTASPVEAGRLVKLGLVSGFSDTKDFMLGYADGLESEQVLADVIQKLSSVYGQGPGIILTSSRVSETLPLPGRHKLLSLGRAFSGFGRSLQPDPSVFAERLGERRAEKLAPGVKGQKRISYEVWHAQHVLSDWPTTRLEQAKRIVENWPKGSTCTTQLSTIQNHLPEFESGRYPRPTK